MNITYQNQNNTEYERLFNELIADTFGFSFAPWFELKLWDAHYESFSIIERSKMLSNICLFKTSLTAMGKRYEAYQLGAVATRKEERGKGLSRKLMQHILSVYPYAPMFLFANESVVDFYPRFGFQRVYESKPRISWMGDNPGVSANRLAPEHPMIREYLANDRKCSDILYCDGTEPVAMFHLLFTYRNDIYHIPSLDTLVVAKANDGDLFVAYINKPMEVALDAILRCLPFAGIRAVTFGFMTDLLNLPCEWKRMASGDESMFVKGIALPEPFAFPALAKT